MPAGGGQGTPHGDDGEQHQRERHRVNLANRFLTSALANWASACARDRFDVAAGGSAFGSLLKRGISGTYVSVEPFHLFCYLDEQAFHINNRKPTDGERFSVAVSGIVRKRLTFDQLTGKMTDVQTMKDPVSPTILGQAQ